MIDAIKHFLDSYITQDILIVVFFVFLASFELVRLGRNVLVAIGLGRIPRPVGAEEVEPEEKRGRFTPSTFQPVDGFAYRAGDARIRFLVRFQIRRKAAFIADRC